MSRNTRRCHDLDPAMLKARTNFGDGQARGGGGCCRERDSCHHAPPPAPRVPFTAWHRAQPRTPTDRTSLTYFLKK